MVEFHQEIDSTSQANDLKISDKCVPIVATAESYAFQPIVN